MKTTEYTEYTEGERIGWIPFTRRTSDSFSVYSVWSVVFHFPF
jgi:hypothetical protein